MRPTAVTSRGSSQNLSPLDILTAQIGRLLRHPAYRRESVVSSLLQRHLPKDAGYAWNGEAALRDRLGRAALDAASIDHLIRNAQAEIQRLRGPSDA
ncbi:MULTISPECIES: hypothetical protein [unclassified Methylobacterium]|uniref:hypothetical protein n=1 Tax=unclassified Methylobacterium TaxID=2615210 RepID=UPI0011C1F8D5|nr:MULTISPECIES: hypothetical protein [unclassified Methylobacterium]QEE40725.1 hypothetical protein FVA80_18740 [Methylobacterium sp. WL1]TXN53661.1 hypothetical protein FV241_27230 [Methylobacterium sp. WL2]